MALPTLTPEQRAIALAKAAESRKVRADFKEQLKTGGLSPIDGLDKALSDDILAKMKAADFIVSLPKYGKVKAAEAMESIGVAPNRRLRGLGNAQVAALRTLIGPAEAA